VLAAVFETVLVFLFTAMNPFGIKTEECNGNDWASGCTYRLPALSGCTGMSTFEQLKQSVEKAKAVLNAEARESSRNYFSASFSALPGVGMGVAGMQMGVNFAGAPTNGNGSTNANSSSSNSGSSGTTHTNSNGGGSSGGATANNNNGTNNGSSSATAAVRGVVEHALLVDLNHLTHHQHSPHHHHHHHHHQSHSLHHQTHNGGHHSQASHAHALSLSPDDRLGNLDGGAASTSPVSSSDHHHHHSKNRSTSNSSSAGK